MNEIPSFISIYDDALDKKDCIKIINEFEQNKEKQINGRVGDYEVKLKVKKSIDINHNFNDKTLTSDLLSSCLKYHIQKYKKDFPDINKLPPWRCTSVYNVQKYNPKDGFFKSHCEVSDRSSSIRILVWMIYLNTLQDGGTLFPTYQTGIRAKQGRLVMWPSYWTHMHKGQISPTETKYIATGWYEFS